MKVLKKLSYPDLFTAHCGVILFLLCVAPRFVSMSIALLALVVIFGYVKKQIQFHWNWTGALLISLYLTYVIGTFFTDFPQLAFKLLEHKLSLIVLPLLLMIRFKEHVSYRNIFIGLLLGCLVGMIIGLVRAYSCYQGICWPARNISSIIHPSYFVAYISIVTLYLWLVYYNKRSAYFLFFCLIFTILCSVYTLYTYSLAGLLFGLFLIACASLYFIYVKWKWLGIFGFSILFSVAMLVLYRTSSIFKEQIFYATYDLIEYLKNDSDFINKSYPYSSQDARLILWQMSWEQLCETPLGVGTGNIDHVLQQRMESRVNPLFIEQNLNPHNQYLHTGVEIGIVGLGIFITLLTRMVIYSIRHKNWILLAVVASLAFNSLFESMLQKQSGIVFYTLMFCLLSIPTFIIKQKHEQTKHSTINRGR